MWGAGGYAAAETIRLLHAHPFFELASCQRGPVRMQRSANLRSTAPAARSIPPQPMPGTVRFTAPGQQVHTAPRPEATPAPHRTQCIAHAVPPGIRRHSGARATTPIAPKRTSFRWPPPPRDQLRKNRTTQPLRRLTPLKGLLPGATPVNDPVPDQGSTPRTVEPSGEGSVSPEKPTPCRLPAPIHP